MPKEQIFTISGKKVKIGDREIKSAIILGHTEDTSPSGANDYALIWDDSASEFKKVLLNNLPVYGNAENIVFIDTATFDTEVDNGDSGTSDTINWQLGNKQRSTLTGNVTFSFTDPAGPCNLMFKLVQDATGSRTVNWPAKVKWAGGSAPSLSTSGNSVDIVSFYFDGTDYYGVGNTAFA